jgi:Bifunctional DNA primase/polymerase, N-terminal
MPKISLVIVEDQEQAKVKSMLENDDIFAELEREESAQAGALELASRGVPVIRLKVRSKEPIAESTGWQIDESNIKLTTNPTIIKSHLGNFGCGAIAKSGGFCFLEIDDNAVFARITQETVSEDFPEGRTLPPDFTFIVRSRPAMAGKSGRGHLYFRHTEKSIALGNLNQTYVKNQDWSFRANGHYVVCLGSTHEVTGLRYEPVSNADIQPIPDWLVDWMATQRIRKDKKEVPRDDFGQVIHGNVHGFLTSAAGHMRAACMSIDKIEDELLDVAHKHCAPPVDEDKVKQIARSMGNYEEGTQYNEILLNQKGAVLVGGRLPEVRVDAVEEEQPKIPMFTLPPSALTSSRLGDIYADIFQPNGWCLEMALPALATAASVIVPRMPRSNSGADGLLLTDDPMVNLYTAQIAGVGVGKSQVDKWAAKALAIWNNSDKGEHYYSIKTGSAEQLMNLIYRNQDKFKTAVLIDPDEWSHLMGKAKIDNASFPSVLTSAFYKRNYTFSAGGRPPKELSFNIALSFTGGVVEEEFDTVFGAQALGGLYDRFLFGRAPAGFKWGYCDYPAEHLRGRLSWTPTPVQTDPSVYEVLKAWSKKDLGRIAEVCTRVALIFASCDGRSVITGKDLEALEPLAQFQMDIRALYKPNAGQNPEAQYANAVVAWVNKHAQQWQPLRKLNDDLRRWHDKVGPTICDRARTALARAGEIELWLATNDRLGAPNPMPADYPGTRPRLGLVRAVKKDV